MSSQNIYILGIESSCDDTAASVLHNGTLLSNIIATQTVHEAYGGVVPELASRAHQQHIVPVVAEALRQAGITKDQLSAVAFTRGPGLMGALLVGTSFAKSLAWGLGIPLIAVNHMQGHILAHFIDSQDRQKPPFPFLAMTISGGHTQIVRVDHYLDMTVLGETIDDAVGEAFDKTGKILGLGYPAGPEIDRRAKLGNPKAFRFTKPQVAGLNFSFSGLKTAILYFVQRETQKNPCFIKERLNDICASVQYTITNILMDKLTLAAQDTGIKHVAIGGGVSANSGVREALKAREKTLGWTSYIPPFEFTTDNAAMIAIVGHLKYLEGDFSDQRIAASARLHI